MQSITMTLDALHGNLDELRRLKKFIVEERTTDKSSVAHSTRSATISLSSPIELLPKTSDVSPLKRSAVAKATNNSPRVLEAQRELLEYTKRNLNVHQDQSNLIDDGQIFAQTRSDWKVRKKDAH